MKQDKQKVLNKLGIEGIYQTGKPHPILLHHGNLYPSSPVQGKHTQSHLSKQDWNSAGTISENKKQKPGN